MARQTVDLVVLDLRLQGEDGMQIARRLRETRRFPSSCSPAEPKRPTA